jgi:exodeoxyribonuclease III
MVRIVSWNINSVRARLELVEKLVKAESPDIICLQETKVQDHEFPLKPFEKLGYRFNAIKGQKSYHGVATLSRLPLENIEMTDWCNKGDARHVAVTCKGVAIHNFYVPAGGDVPDRDENEKFDHKLNFFDQMTRWAEKLKAPAILLGDLNVAPSEADVWSHKALLKVVSHTPIEVACMEALFSAHDWVDAVRHFVPEDEPLFSWWSYRARDWRASNKGRRLDHIWASASLKGLIKESRVLIDARGWHKPSDHAPVILDIDL